MAPRKQFLLRIDPALWRELERWAADDLRSVNAQVEWLLRDVVRTRRGGSAASGASRGGTPNEGGAAGGGGPERPPAAPPEAAPRDFDDH